MKKEDFCRLKSGLMNLEPEIWLPDSRDEIQGAIREILSQTPELFWFYGSLQAQPEREGYRLFPNYTMTPGEAYAAGLANIFQKAIAVSFF